MAATAYSSLSADNIGRRRYPITPHDTNPVGTRTVNGQPVVDFTGPYKLLVTGAGDVTGKLLNLDGSVSTTPDTITGVPAGTYIETLCFTVITTATTATGLVAVFP